eukprot:TRINITY_DN253_c0_g1_i4.p2 TRINITY_DN253_c0_g1~~TRINITY_DN253_c0_g1_i4.p2  ORF type:complete len:289 (-),score=-0.49 TRINITY_DN253_c0_g1_i4:50-916(-)
MEGGKNPILVRYDQSPHYPVGVPVSQMPSVSFANLGPESFKSLSSFVLTTNVIRYYCDMTFICNVFSANSDFCAEMHPPRVIGPTTVSQTESLGAPLFTAAFPHASNGCKERVFEVYPSMNEAMQKTQFLIGKISCSCTCSGACVTVKVYHASKEGETLLGRILGIRKCCGYASEIEVEGVKQYLLETKKCAKCCKCKSYPGLEFEIKKLPTLETVSKFVKEWKCCRTKLSVLNKVFGTLPSEANWKEKALLVIDAICFAWAELQKGQMKQRKQLLLLFQVLEYVIIT